MKAICLLLCLTLSRDIAGSIFRPQFDPRMANLVVQPLELLSDQQTIEQYHRQQHQRQHPRHRPVSSETSQSDSKETATYEDSDYLTSPINTWNAALHSAVISQANERPTSDVISWMDKQIAAVPTYPASRQNEKEKSSIFYDAFITMKHMTDEEKKRFHEAYQTAVQASNEDVKLDAPELLKKHQYDVEEHTVKTDDGYLLTLFRIPAKEEQRQQQSSEVRKAPVVFLMHGLLGSADDWLLMGPGKSLAYLLSDAGYDVWLGNSRGNKYSRRHVSKHPAQPDFWQFTTDEIALHDLPAMIDYTLNKTEQQKLVFVGHSQGTTAFFALTSTRPEYNEKISMMYAISPMVYMSNVRSPLLRMISASYQIHGGLKDTLLGEDNFNPSKILIHLAGGNMCEYEIGCKEVCSNVNFVMTGVNTENVDVSLIPVIMSHLPAGTSIKQVKQYGQAVATHEFRKYDYGADINEKMYGQPEPPKYDMTKVQVPVALYYSEKDWMAHPKDVDRLRQELPNVQDTYKVPEQFTHMDFQFSKKAPEVVYKRLIESIKNHHQ